MGVKVNSNYNYSWKYIKEAIEDLYAKVEAIPEYTAGDNISISDAGVISATDTKYTAGSGIEISDQNVISATASGGKLYMHSVNLTSTTSFRQCYIKILSSSNSQMTISAIKNNIKNIVAGYEEYISSGITYKVPLLSASIVSNDIYLEFFLGGLEDLYINVERPNLINTDTVTEL